jgi:colanic acid/amylovoran biosynthesis protein
MKTREKIYIRGYFCCNLGDDLFLHILAQRYKNTQFILVADSNAARAFHDESNIKVIHNNLFVNFINKLTLKTIHFEIINWFIERLTNASIMIGGSMFQEIPSTENAILRIKTYPHRKNKTYLIGSNFGPYSSDRYLNEVKSYLSKLNDACFRDRYSYSLLCDSTRARYAPDIVFGLKKIYNKNIVKKSGCIISVMNFRDNERLQKYAGTYEQYICRCIDYFSKRNIKITLVSLCEDDGDTAAIERISQKYKDKSINRSYYNGHNWKSIIDEFQTSEYVIATRFHSMILGLEYGSKVLPIVYNQKTKYVLEDLGLEKWGISLPNLSESLISEDCFIEKPDVECVSAESEAQFKALDGLLMNHLNNL